MYYKEYIILSLVLLFCIIIASIASAKVNSSFNKYSKVSNKLNITGAEVARKLLSANNIISVIVKQTEGKLTDHFHPKNSTVNLSSEVYNGATVASAAIAAHEVAHVVQKEEGYFFYKIRTFLVPVLNVVSKLAFPLVIIGVLLDILLLFGSNIGFAVAMIGVIFYGGSLLFSLITLPVELDASKRALQMLLSEGILSEDEIDGSKKVLSSAAFTYFASFLISLVYFLRFLVYVLHIFGRNRD